MQTKYRGNWFFATRKSNVQQLIRKIQYKIIITHQKTTRQFIVMKTFIMILMPDNLPYVMCVSKLDEYRVESCFNLQFRGMSKVKV